jgi:hypothetical protein
LTSAVQYVDYPRPPTTVNLLRTILVAFHEHVNYVKQHAPKFQQILHNCPKRPRAVYLETKDGGCDHGLSIP